MRWGVLSLFYRLGNRFSEVEWLARGHNQQMVESGSNAVCFIPKPFLRLASAWVLASSWVLSSFSRRALWFLGDQCGPRFPYSTTSKHTPPGSWPFNRLTSGRAASASRTRNPSGVPLWASSHRLHHSLVPFLFGKQVASLEPSATVATATVAKMYDSQLGTNDGKRRKLALSHQNCNDQETTWETTCT